MTLSIGASNSTGNGATETPSTVLTGTTATSTILVGAYGRNLSITNFTCSDPINGSYGTPIGGGIISDANQGVGAFFFFQNNAGGNLTITATETGSTNTICSIGAIEILGAVTSGGLGQSDTHVFTAPSGGAACPTIITSGSQAVAMIVSMQYGSPNVATSPTNNYTGAAPASSWTIAPNTTQNSGGGGATGCISYHLVSSLGTYSDAYFLTGCNYWWGAAATVAILGASTPGTATLAWFNN